MVYVARGVFDKETDLRLGVEPLQPLLFLERRNRYSVYLVAINVQMSDLGLLAIEELEWGPLVVLIARGSVK